MNDLIKQEIEKINTLTFLNDEKRNQLIQAAPYTTIPYMPITTEFIERHILNNNEYPLIESKLSQAAIELKARINRLVDAQFNINKTQLDIQELLLDIEDIQQNDKLSLERIDIQVKKKQLEIQQKKWLILGYTNDSDTNYQEFTQWKQTIEDCLTEIQKNDPSIKDLSQIRYDRIRIEEIKIKIDRWKKMQEAGVELTASQKALL